MGLKNLIKKVLPSVIHGKVTSLRLYSKIIDITKDPNEVVFYCLYTTDNPKYKLEERLGTRTKNRFSNKYSTLKPKEPSLEKGQDFVDIKLPFDTVTEVKRYKIIYN